MIVTEENEKYILEAMKTDVLAEQWEREWYTLALMRAAEWGQRIDRKNNDFKKKTRLVDKYKDKTLF